MNINNPMGVGARKLAAGTAAALAATLGVTGTASAQPYSARARTEREAPSVSVANQTLTISGTEGPDHVTIGLGKDPNTLVVGFGGDGSLDQKFDRTTFTGINAFLLGGDDQFSVVGPPFTDEKLMVDGGNGNDTITTGAGNDFIEAGNGNDTVNGGPGADTAFLGSEADTFVWNPGDGSDVIDGGTGIDTMVFNGSAASEVMSVSASGPRSVFLRDVGQIRMDMAGVEGLDLHTLGGADSVTVNDTTGTDLSQANIDLAVAGAGDGLVDTVTVNGTPDADHVNVGSDGAVRVRGLRPDLRISGSERSDRLQVNTLDGNDRVHVGDGVSQAIGVAVDLGAGQH